MGPIVLTGLSANDPVPGRYIETNFAQGPAGGDEGEWPMLLIGNKTTAGSATVDSEIYGPDTLVQAQTEDQVIALFGAGSPLHRAFKRITRVTQDVPVYFIAVTESAGTAASSTITVTNAATANGNVRIWVEDEFVDAAVTSGDAATAIAAAITAAVNEKTHWPVTAATSTNTSVLTAKVKGPRGNYIRIKTSITSSGTIATTVTPTTTTALASGATADSNTTALATILAKRFPYIVSEAEDATQYGALVTQVGVQQAPTTGIRQRAFAGATGTLNAATTIATGLNSARAELIWQKTSDWTPFEIAAHVAACYAAFELGDEVSFVEFGSDEASSRVWAVPVPSTTTAAPTRTDIKTALNNGVTPIAVNGRGTATYLVDRVTTRCLSGSTPDYRIRDAHKVTVCDKFADAMVAKQTKQWPRKRIADNPKKGQPLPSANVVTPDVYKIGIFGLIDDFDSRELLQQVDLIKQGTVTQRSVTPTTRMEARVPLRPIDILKQWATAIDQVA